MMSQQYEEDWAFPPDKPKKKKEFKERVHKTIEEQREELFRHLQDNGRYAAKPDIYNGGVRSTPAGESFRNMILVEGRGKVITLEELLIMFDLSPLGAEDMVRRFKRNMNHAKSKLIEENARQKKEMEDLIAQSREQFEEEKAAFKESVARSCLRLREKAAQFDEACTEMVRSELSDKKLKEKVKSVKKLILGQLDNQLKKEVQLFEEVRLDLDKTFASHRSSLEQQRGAYKKNLRELYEKEREMCCERMLDMERDAELLRNPERIELSCEGIVNETVTKRLRIVEGRYTRQVKLICKALRLNSDACREFESLCYMEGSENMLAHEILQLALLHDTDADQYSRFD